MSPDQKIGDMIIFSDVAPFFVKIANFQKISETQKIFKNTKNAQNYNILVQGHSR